jgi:predicted DNA-binding protein (UPF0251 family)
MVIMSIGSLLEELMPRPPRRRRLFHQPSALVFGPLDRTANGEVTLSPEGLEALRHSELEGLDQEAAAQLMGVSRQTYGRVLSEARRIVAQAVCEASVLRVAGGAYRWANPEEAGRHHGHHGRRGRGRGKWANQDLVTGGNESADD